MKSDEEICKQFRTHKSVTDRGLSNQRNNSDLCDRFMVGDYMNYQGYIDDPKTRKRVQVQFSKPAPYVKAVHGFMAQNRRKAKYIARIEQDQEQETYTKSANAIAYYVRKNARADQVESQQNLQMLIKGYGATETAMSYNEGYATRDPNGEIIIGDVTEEVGWDPMARDTNLLAARWVFYRKSYAIDDAKTLFGVSEEELEDNASEPEDDSGYQYDPNIYPYDRSKITPAYEWDSRADRTVWVYFYQWQEIEKFYRADNPIYKITDPIIQRMAMIRMDSIEAEAENNDSMFRFDATAERLTFDSKTKKLLEDLFGDRIKCFDYPRKVFYTAVLSGEKIFKKYRNQSQQGFTVKFKTGYWDNVNKIWYGMVNPMMEPTKYSNKFLTELMYTIAANSKGGWLITENATDNIKKFEATINKTDGVTVVNDLNAVKEKKSPFLPTGYDQLMGIAEGAISEMSGIDKQFMMNDGSSGNMTAQLHRQVVKQVTASLANYFDAEAAYAEEHARMLLDFMKVYAENNEGGIIRLVGEEDGVQFMRISQDAFAPEYDVDIIEAPQTQEEKMEMAQIIGTMSQTFLSIGDIASGKAAAALQIKYLPLDASDKQELLKVLQPGDDPRVAEMQATIDQLTNGMAQAQRAALDAQTQFTVAKTGETAANVQKKVAEIKKLGADIENTAADTALTAEKIEQTNLENILLPKTAQDKVSVNV